MSSPSRLQSQTPQYLLVAAFSAGLLMLHTSCAVAAPEIEMQQSEIRFTSKQMNVPIQGVFKKFSGKLEFDPKKLSSSKVSLSIDLGSIDLHDPETNQEVIRPAWLSTKLFPQAIFVSQQIEATGTQQYKIKGTLTIKGIQREMIIPLQLKPQNSTANKLTEAMGQFAIKRLDFKIGEGAWADTNTVADDIDVQFRFLVKDLY